MGLKAREGLYVYVFTTVYLTIKFHLQINRISLDAVLQKVQCYSYSVSHLRKFNAKPQRIYSSVELVAAKGHSKCQQYNQAHDTCSSFHQPIFLEILPVSLVPNSRQWETGVAVLIACRMSYWNSECLTGNSVLPVWVRNAVNDLPTA